MGDEGLEPPDVNHLKDRDLGQTPETGAAESGAVGPISAELAEDLARITIAWPSLSEPIRRAMIALVEAGQPNKQ
jgi:hypothetical protein